MMTLQPGSWRRVHCPAIRKLNGDRIDENSFPEEDECQIFFPTILSHTFLKAEWEADF